MRRFEWPWHLLDAVLPSLCFGCRERLGRTQSYGACPRCWLSLNPAPGGRARRLGRLTVWSAVPYSDRAKRMLWRAKFGRRRELFLPMGRMLGSLSRLLPTAPSCIVPVPSHPGRTLSRGFSPGYELARSLAGATGLPIRRILIRRWWPRNAIKGLGRDRRKSLAEKAFRLRGAVRGEAVLLVDDLLTTGSTLESCSRLCVRDGAASVQALVWAEAARS